MLNIISIVTPAGRVLATRGNVAEFIATHDVSGADVRPFRGFHASPGTAQMVVGG